MIRLLRFIADSMDNPQSRGSFGEMIVASIFDNRFFGDEEHYIVNDLLFGTPDGKTHQIDHVVIYKTGVFCVETKNIVGLIIGHQDANEWKVYVHSGAEPYNIYNPLMQNKGHVNVLSKFLNRSGIHSVVVFIKGNKPKDCSEAVINIQELKDYIKNYRCEKELNSNEMKEIYGLLTSHKEVVDIMKTDHIKNVKEIKNKNH